MKTVLMRLRSLRRRPPSVVERINSYIYADADAPALRCSRCDRAVEPQDLSPGRYWCRPCENARRRRIYKANRAAAQNAAYDSNLRPIFGRDGNVVGWRKP